MDVIKRLSDRLLEIVYCTWFAICLARSKVGRLTKLTSSDLIAGVTLWVTAEVTSGVTPKTLSYTRCPAQTYAEVGRTSFALVVANVLSGSARLRSAVAGETCGAGFTFTTCTIVCR